MTEGVTVTLTPKERSLINEALTYYRAIYTLSRAEDEVADNLLRRIRPPFAKESR